MAFPNALWLYSTYALYLLKLTELRDPRRTYAVKRILWQAYQSTELLVMRDSQPSMHGE